LKSRISTFREPPPSAAVVKLPKASFPQKGDEISTCGNRLLMNFLNAGSGSKIPQNQAENFF
jgi:hypothetical protein